MYYNAIEVAMVVTDVGDVAGGALICAGSNSIIGAYTSEASGGSTVAGWTGGMITGAACGLGAGVAGGLLTNATNATGVACLGYAAGGGAIAFGSGFGGSLVGQAISSAIDGRKVQAYDLLMSATFTGTINILSGIGAGMGTAIQGMPQISTTTITIANTLNAVCSLVSEAVCDIMGTLPSLLPSLQGVWTEAIM